MYVSVPFTHRKYYDKNKMYKIIFYLMSKDKQEVIFKDQ